MKHALIHHAKKITLGILVVSMGALGIAGGSRTIVLLKNWFQSLFGQDS